MWLLTKLFPLRLRPEFARYSLEELRREYRPWDYALVIFFLLLAPYCVYALHELFLWHTQFVAQDLGESVYTVLPDSIFWYAPASVLGVILACVLVSILYHALLGMRANQYRYYANLAAGMNASRMYLVFGLLLGCGFAGLAVFAAHSSFQLTKDEIVLHRLFGVDEERYPYAQVKGLKQVSSPDGKSAFVIEFEDAPDWTTAVEIVFPGDSEIAYLSQRSGKPVQSVAAE